LPLYDTVGDNLYRKGYLASRWDKNLICVEKEDGNYYLVNPRLNTCTCEAGRRGNDCKHRRGLADLVFLSVQFWFSCGEGIAAKHLNDWWFDFTTEVRN
jgi:hypothetical protein